MDIDMKFNKFALYLSELIDNEDDEEDLGSDPRNMSPRRSASRRKTKLKKLMTRKATKQKV